MPLAKLKEKFSDFILSFKELEYPYKIVSILIIVSSFLLPAYIISMPSKYYDIKLGDLDKPVSTSSQLEPTKPVNTNSQDVPIPTVEEETTPFGTSKVQELSTDKLYWAYVEESSGDIYIASEDSTKFSVAKNGSFFLSNPKIINTTEIVYIRRKDLDANIIIQNLVTGEIELVSAPRGTFYLNIYDIAVSDNTRYLAYTSRNMNDRGSALGKEELTINLYNLNTKETTTLVTLDSGGGRGGGLNDDNSIIFSNDGDHLIATLTFALPNNDPSVGSLYIFDLTREKSEIIYYREAGGIGNNEGWDTFGIWISNDTAYFKRVNSPSNLISFNINSGESSVKKAGIDDWYGFVSTGQNSFVYYSVNTENGEGIILYEYNIDTEESTKLADNMMPLFTDDNRIFTNVMKPCGQNDGSNNIGGCGMDVFNGVTFSNEIKVINLETKETSDIPFDLSGTRWGQVNFKKL